MEGVSKFTHFGLTCTGTVEDVSKLTHSTLKMCGLFVGTEIQCNTLWLFLSQLYFSSI